MGEAKEEAEVSRGRLITARKAAFIILGRVESGLTLNISDIAAAVSIIRDVAPIWGEGEPLIQEFPKGLE